MILVMQSSCIVFVEILFYKLFMESFCDYRNQKWQRRSFFLVLTAWAEILVITFFLSSHFMAKEVVTALLLFITASVFYKARIIKTITLTILYLAVLIATDYLTLIIYYDIFTSTPENDSIVRTMIMIFSKITLFLIILVIQRITEKSEIASLTDAQWIKLLFFPVISICMLGMILSKTYVVNVKEFAELFWMVAFGLLGMNIFFFFLIRDISRKERRFREKKIAEIQMKNQLMLYRSIAENFEKQNKRLHEYKNQIECLHALCQERSYAELEQYLSQIGEEMFDKTDAVDTHHAMVNAIINSKYQRAVKNGIVVVFQLDDLSALWITEHDIVVLLANLFDNAIEACQKLEHRRTIKMKMVIENHFLVLSMCNTYNGRLRSRDGILLSTKEDAGYEHGIGIKNIIKIVEKYGGSYIIEQQEIEFLFSIMIPQKNNIAN